MNQQTAAANVLSDYVSSLQFETLPHDVRQTAFLILKDAMACAAFGARFEWAQIAARYVRSLEGKPEVPVFGFDGLSLPVPSAAFLFGVMGHAYELDNLRRPGAGVHPGVTVALPALAYALAHPEITAEDIITAIVAGCEVMFRIGAATLHTPEKAGFHAPGLTGAFGAATAVGKLMGLDTRALRNAYGISGSVGGGLLAFTSAGHGGMVKRLHLGRAAEAGIQAAMLANGGFEGPSNILEGKFGLLDAYCRSSNPDLLIEGLGEYYEIRNTCFKRFAAHITAHTPIEGLEAVMMENGLETKGIDNIVLLVSEKLISHHNNVNPSDLAGAQYSVPFMVAASLYVDVRDPRNIGGDLLKDGRVRDMASRIRLIPNGQKAGWDCSISVHGPDGRAYRKDNVTYSGGESASSAFINEKYDILTSDVPGMPDFDKMLERIASSLSVS